jgi:hypothetical protein
MVTPSRIAADAGGERTTVCQMLQDPLGFSEVAAEAIIEAGYNSIETFRTMMIGDAISEFFKNLTMEYNRKGPMKASPILKMMMNLSPSPNPFKLLYKLPSHSQPHVAQQNLRTFLFHIKICKRLGRSPDRSKFNAEKLLFARERLLFEEPLNHTSRTTSNTPDNFPLTIADWFRIQKQMMAYLSDLRGIANVPYSYLIRDKNVPDDSDFEMEYDPSDAFFVACTAHHGTHYDIDNKWFAAEPYKLAAMGPLSPTIFPPPEQV